MAPSHHEAWIRFGRADSCAQECQHLAGFDVVIANTGGMSQPEGTALLLAVTGLVGPLLTLLVQHFIAERSARIHRETESYERDIADKKASDAACWALVQAEMAKVVTFFHPQATWNYVRDCSTFEERFGIYDIKVLDGVLHALNTVAWNWQRSAELAIALAESCVTFRTAWMECRDAYKSARDLMLVIGTEEEVASINATKAETKAYKAWQEYAQVDLEIRNYIGSFIGYDNVLRYKGLMRTENSNV